MTQNLLSENKYSMMHCTQYQFISTNIILNILSVRKTKAVFEIIIQKLMGIWNKMSNKSYCLSNLRQKHSVHKFSSPTRVELEGFKDFPFFEYFNMFILVFKAERCNKYRRYKKKVDIKVV